MKYIVILYISLLTPFLAHSQAVISKPVFTKSIQDFGAVANDGKDDTWAFIKAGKYFSNLWDINGVPLVAGRSNFNDKEYSGQLVIPSGEYRVGRQIPVPASGLATTYGKIFDYPAATASITYPAGQAYKAGLELIKLKGVDQIKILGTGATRPVIRYNDDLVIGYFDNKAAPMWFPATNYDGKYYVSVGNFLDADNCRNIAVENLSIDGNNRPTFSGGKTIYNGGWASDLIQAGASGAYFINSKNISLTKLDIQYMTLDGLIIQDYYRDTVAFPAQALSNIFIDSVKCNYNRRQGFSWVGGRKLTVSNSSFNHTGTTVSGIAGGNPGAGVDIEPESDGTNLLYCIDARFTNCEFINNTGCALVNDQSALRSKKIDFENCTFHDVTGYSVWVKGKSFTFSRCKIWGGFVFGNPGLVPGEETRFYSCDFADEEMPGKKGIHNKGYALIESWQSARRLYFEDCGFRTLHETQRLAAIFTPVKEEESFTVFKDCRFTSRYGQGNNIMFGCVFDGNTDIINNGDGLEDIALNGIIFKGSGNASKPYSFNLSGKILFHPANTNGPGMTQFIIGRSNTGTQNNGYLNFVIGAESCVYGYWSQQIDIGKNAVLTNKGQLAMLSGTINLDGKLKLDAKSYTAFFNPVDIKNNNANAPQFIYDQTASFYLSDTWKKLMPGLAGGVPISGLKISKNISVKKEQ